MRARAPYPKPVGGATASSMVGGCRDDHDDHDNDDDDAATAAAGVVDRLGGTRLRLRGTYNTRVSRGLIVVRRVPTGSRSCVRAPYCRIRDNNNNNNNIVIVTYTRVV